MLMRIPEGGPWVSTNVMVHHAIRVCLWRERLVAIGETMTLMSSLCVDIARTESSSWCCRVRLSFKVVFHVNKATASMQVLSMRRAIIVFFGLLVTLLPDSRAHMMLLYLASIHNRKLWASCLLVKAASAHDFYLLGVLIHDELLLHRNVTVGNDTKRVTIALDVVPHTSGVARGAL